jgi:hypothetical protein
MDYMLGECSLEVHSAFLCSSALSLHVYIGKDIDNYKNQITLFNK